MLAGNNTAAVLVLDLLLERLPPLDVLVLAPPGAARPGWQESLSDAAHVRGVEALVPDDVNDRGIVDAIAAHGADLLLSVYYTQIFRTDLLDAVAGPALNFHPSLLPRHRGHAPVVWAIAEGDSVTGLSVHHLDRGIDTGPLVYRRSLPIHPLDTGFELHRKMNQLVRATAADLLRQYFAGSPIATGEDQTGPASSHSRRDPQLNHLDWSLPADRVRNIVRALAPPLPGAFVRFGETTIVLAEVEQVGASTDVSRATGMVEFDSDGTPVVWAGNGPVRLCAFVGSNGDVRPGRELAALGLATGSVLT